MTWRTSFFFNDTATTEIYTLSLHDALPICAEALALLEAEASGNLEPTVIARQIDRADRKSTRLNSSHVAISYAVFCLKKKKQTCQHMIMRKKKNKRRKK